jgi:hypothetical protein
MFSKQIQICRSFFEALLIAVVSVSSTGAAIAQDNDPSAPDGWRSAFAQYCSDETVCACKEKVFADYFESQATEPDAAEFAVRSYIAKTLGHPEAMTPVTQTDPEASMNAVMNASAILGSLSAPLSSCSN